MTMAQRDACMVAESAQLARLCDLAEPLVEVLLLLPGPPNPDVLSYWDKILQVRGWEQGGARATCVRQEGCVEQVSGSDRVFRDGSVLLEE